MNDRYMERTAEPFPKFPGNDSRKVGGEAGFPHQGARLGRDRRSLESETRGHSDAAQEFLGGDLELPQALCLVAVDAAVPDLWVRITIQPAIR